MSGLNKTATLLAFSTIYFLLFYLSYRVAYFFYLDSLPYSSVIDLVIFFPSFTTFVLFILYRHRTREASLAQDAKRWLANRELEQTQSTALAKKKGSRSRIWLWAPCGVVLLVAPFITEEIGVASHLFVSQTAVVGKYQIQIPVTWIIDGKREDFLSAMTVPGIGRIGVKTYWNFSPPLTTMTFYTVAHPEEQLAPNIYLKGATILAKRSFGLGGERLTCWDFVRHSPYGGSYPDDPTIARIECTTESDHFYAGFDGWRPDASVFYETLQKIEISELSLAQR